LTNSRATESTDKVHRRLVTYRCILGLNMSLHLAIGLGCMFLPYFVSSTLGLPPPVPKGWIVGWGATLILVTALYIPGLRDPLGTRYPNVCGIGGRIWMATVWFVLGGGFFTFGVFDASFAAILAFFYYRLTLVADR
jgi:hypothetical protein